jgi:hypothetical protein
MVIIKMASSAKKTIVGFRILFLLMNRRQWVVDVHRADALTLAAVGNWYLVVGLWQLASKTQQLTMAKYKLPIT